LTYTFERPNRARKHQSDSTIGFSLLYVLVIVRLARRELAWINRHSTPDGRMDRAANYRGLPLERGSALPDPRPGRDVRRCRRAPTTSHGSTVRGFLLTPRGIAQASCPLLGETPWKNSPVTKRCTRAQCRPETDFLGSEETWQAPSAFR
jgi:hypothetical protein